MCSVVGGFINRKPTHNADMVESLFLKSQGRGRDQVGYKVWRADGATHTQKHLDGESYQLELPREQAYTFIGCLRGEPTTEWHGNTTDVDVQPFQVGKWIVVHNGTIANDREITSTANKPTETDTWSIAYALDKFGWSRGVHKLVGSFAFLAYNEDEPGTLYWACNYKPLYLLGSSDGFTYTFASQQSYFPWHEDRLRGPQPVQLGPYAYGTLTNKGKLTQFSLYNFRAKRTLAVCSGGLDSTVAAWLHHEKGAKVDLLHFRYKCQAQDAEVAAVEALAAKMGTRVHYVDTDFFSVHAQSTLTTPGAAVAQGEAGAEYAHEWVPARNTVMLAHALAFAEAHEYTTIVLGSNQEESCGGYPDNEQEFINKWNELAPFAVKPYHPVRFADPLGGSMKKDIVELGFAYDAPMELSWSCYKGGVKHCGTCGPCTMRRRAFEMAEVIDPTEYEA
jgi:7-cyano-7-deazaguanine synthase